MARQKKKELTYEEEMALIREQKIRLELKEVEVENKHYKKFLNRYQDLIDDDVLNELYQKIDTTITDSKTNTEYIVTEKALKKAVKRILIKDFFFDVSDFEERKKEEKADDVDVNIDPNADISFQD